MQVPPFYLFCTDEAQALPELSGEIYFLQILNGLREIGVEGAVRQRRQGEEGREQREQVSSSGGQVSSGNKIEWPSLTSCSSSSGPGTEFPGSYFYLSDGGDRDSNTRTQETQGHIPCLSGNPSSPPMPAHTRTFMSLLTKTPSSRGPCPSHPILSLPKPALGLPASSPAVGGDVGG